MKRIILAGITVIILVAIGLFLYDRYNPLTYYDDEVHVHADFLIYINDQRVDLSAERYQSSAESIKHKNVHLHDGDDHVVHRHADGITFGDFLSSLGFALTDNCLTADDGAQYCSDVTNSLILYVNGQVNPDITLYIPQEEDQILLYYGRRDNPNVTRYLGDISDESCIYSGTCPERGIAPPESCGLTCEI